MPLDPSGPVSYILIVGLLLLCSLFTSSEAALSYCNRYKIKAKADEGNASAKLLDKLFDKFDDAVITILIGTNICDSLLSVVATILMVRLIGASGSLVATIITSIIVVVFGEMIPKNFAKANSERWSMIVIWPITVLMYIFWPLEKFFDLVVWLVRRPFKNIKEESFTEDDFQDVIEKVQEEGVIDEEESEIIINAVDFGDIRVKDVLTKREDIVALDIKDCNNLFVRNFLVKNNYSRIPVYEGSIDNIIGILHVRTYLKQLFHDKNTKVIDVLSKPYIVSPSITLDEIFEGYRQHKTHIAIVKNDKGKTIGMVTMKDVLEELVEEVDESDTPPQKGGVNNA